MAKLSRLTNMTEADLHNGALKVMQDLTGQGLENIDISKLPIEKVDGIDILTPEGAPATRGLIRELLNSIYDNAANFKSIAEGGRDNVVQIKLLKDKASGPSRRS